MSEYVEILDCKGLACPVPIAKLSQAVKKAAKGEKVKIYATDPGFEVDVRAWTQITGNKLDAFEKIGGSFVAVIEKS